MILIVGDTHGNWGALNTLMQKKKPSLVIQCGDFGWWPRMEVKKHGQQKEWLLKGLKVPIGTEVLWVDGNHEDHDDILSMNPQEHEGILCYPQVTYKPRGSTMVLPDGRVVLFFGGAESIDKAWRTPGLDWFPEEIPNVDEFNRAMSHDKVDIVISHTAPDYWVPDICRGDKFNDPTRKALNSILTKYNPSLWYHGHWHKEASGIYKDTKWQSLDYPNHGSSGRWWIELEED